MKRYFKITEIDEEHFAFATGELLDCYQLAVRVGGDVFVGLDANEADVIEIEPDMFDEAE